MGIAILGFGSLVCFGLAAYGFRTGVMYGQAADVERLKNPIIFKFVGLSYCALGMIFLTGAILMARG